MSKNKKYNYLTFWENCMNTGMLPIASGLCDEAGECSDNLDPKLLDLFRPTAYDNKWIVWEGNSLFAWGSGVPEGHQDEWGVFTPLRQTIVLFMAAMNGDL